MTLKEELKLHTQALIIEDMKKGTKDKLKLAALTITGILVSLGIGAGVYKMVQSGADPNKILDKSEEAVETAAKEQGRGSSHKVAGLRKDISNLTQMSKELPSHRHKIHNIIRGMEKMS